MTIVIKSIRRPESAMTLPVIDGHAGQRQEGVVAQKVATPRPLDISAVKSQSAAAGVSTPRQILGASGMTDLAISAVVPEKSNDDQAMRARATELREQAKKQGYEEGLKQAREAIEAEWRPRIERLARMLDHLGAKQDEMLASQEDDLVCLVFEAVCRIVGDRAISREAAQEAVKRCLATFEKGLLLVRVAPADFEMLLKELPDQNTGAAASFRIVEDPRVSLGGCILESERGMLDARLETQIERLRLSLLEARDLVVSA